MKIQRIKSIDIFRGLCMAWMILNHLISWWLNNKYSWLHGITVMILDPIGASGFLFISGVSIALSYKNRVTSVEYNHRWLRNSYLFRAFCIFLIAMIYNTTISLYLNSLLWIWTWFVLLTVAISMFISWPLLKTSKIFRILLGIFIIIANQYLFSVLLPYRGENNVFGVFFHILYHRMGQDPILSFFPFFLFGTVIGDILFESYNNLNENSKKKYLKINLIIPSLAIGSLLIISGILFIFPNFLERTSFSWIIYSLGIELLIFSLLLIFEEFIINDIKKSFKFLFYYSYYSLTVYLGHNLLYFLFFESLNIYDIWIFILATFIILGLLLRFIYKKWGAKASIKIQIGKLSSILTMKIEAHKRNQDK